MLNQYFANITPMQRQKIFSFTQHHKTNKHTPQKQQQPAAEGLATSDWAQT